MSSDTLSLTFQDVITEVLAEVKRAESLYPPMRNIMEGYGILLEELDEAWDDIKANDVAGARSELIQVAAMTIRNLYCRIDDYRHEGPSFTDFFFHIILDIPPVNSAHEGYALIKREHDQLWSAIMSNVSNLEIDYQLFQLGGQTIRLLMDVYV